MKTREIPVDQLSGPALDWAVAKALRTVESEDRFKRDFVMFVLGDTVEVPAVLVEGE